MKKNTIAITILFSAFLFATSCSTSNSDNTNTHSLSTSENSESGIVVETQYEVRWFDGDGTLIHTSYVAEGEEPVYDGPTPVKTSTETESFSFKNWKFRGSVGKVYFYDAIFNKSERKYSVTWKNWNGEVLDVEEYSYNSTPEYANDTPIKNNDSEKWYVFTGWSPSISKVKNDVIYTAEYESFSLAYERFDDVFHTRKDLNTGFSMVEEHDYDCVLYGADPDSDIGDWYKYVFTCKKCGHVFKERRELFATNFYTISDGYVTITDIGLTADTTIAIPPSINGYPVKVLGGKNNNNEPYHAFSKNQQVKQVWLPKTIEKLCDFVFGSSSDECNQIESLNLPSGLTGIDRYSLFGLHNGQNMKHLTISSSFSATNNAFLSGYENLEYNKYGNCSYIGYFDNPYYALVKVEDKSLTNYDIHPDCKMLCARAFYECNNITSISIPDDVHTMEQSVFANCSNLQTIALPSSLHTLCSYTFSDCNSLTEIIIPEGLEVMQNTCIYNCPYLNKIIIPLSVNEIEYFSIQNTPYLTVYCRAESKPSSWNSSWYHGIKTVIFGYSGN